MGEVQALYHELVLAFRRDSSLMASDVLVMVSDIELFAPFIDAVFQKKIGEIGAIPYRIVGKKGGGDSFKYLENCARVARGKCSASEVMALLDHPYSRERFGLDQPEVEMIERWVSRLPVWWGISPEMRESFGSPEPVLNTFFWGVERLLLSFPFAQPFPVENVMAFDGGDLWEVAPVLEKFQVFIKLVLDLGHRLPDEESGFFWGETASWMAMNLFPDDFGVQEPEIHAALVSFSRILAPVDDEDEASRMASLKIPYDGFLRMLENHMRMAKGDSSGKMGHGVTFAPIVSSRGISSRFLALLGMSSDLFTLKDRIVSFDPLMNSPRSGDHSRREDDQGIFLEALLSAKDSLFISYSGTGQEPFDEILPSVPLAHLIDWVRTMNPEWRNFVTRWSLVEGFFRKREPVQNTGYPSIPLPDDMNEDIPAFFPIEIELDDLKRFVRNPSRFFWSFWGGGALKNSISSLASSDPFVPGLMESRFLGKTIFSYMNEHDGEIPPKSFLTPFGFLPHGSGSGSVFESLSASIFRLWKEKDFFLSQYPGSEIPLHELSLAHIPEMIGQTFRFHGSLDGQVFLKGDDIHHVVFFPYFHSKRDVLSLWVDHLLLSLCFQDKVVVSTIYSLSGSGRESYCVKGGAKRALQDLFAIFCYGEIFPVPIFLKSSWEYVECWKKFRKKEDRSKSGKVTSDFSFDSKFPWGDPKGADRRKALEKAEKLWISQRKTPDISPEEMILYAKASPWARLPGSDPEQLLPSEKISLRVFSPILGSIVDEKKKKASNEE
jgi:exodeoxyribonuclease V gamma subunit